MSKPDRTTLQDDCECFNAAFLELGFDWQWDPALYASLDGIADERQRVAAYVRQALPHLLSAYDVDFLCDAILDARRQCAPRMAAAA